MLKFIDKIFPVLFGLVFFLTPLILWPYTSELFEFNKVVFIYTMTVLIVAAWLSRCILERKFIFRRTILDIPLLIFIASQILSTIFSLDQRTSFLGYYSRFHGGLLSTLCYCLLYWAYVANMDRKKTLFTIRCLLFSAAIVSAYGILEHFGIDKNIWVQDVQNRVFSTLGQPNWLAAYLTAIIPITWAFALNSKLKTKNFWVFFFLSSIFFLTLLYTKSRSGLAGFIVAYMIFWSGAFWIYRRFALKSFLAISSSLLVVSLTVGFPFKFPINQKGLPSEARRAELGPALETGGTESGTIRKIVWKGAVEIWKHYPIVGSGVETFAFAYPRFRPQEHNLVSEWDFIYNKAHNEYLNFLTTTGVFGTLSYLTVILFSLLQISKKNPDQLALLAGYASILVTNFFGFSVVPVALLFFLFPGIGIVLSTEYVVPGSAKSKLSNAQKTVIVFVLCSVLYVLFAMGKYWYADIYFNKGRQLNLQNQPAAAFKSLQKAISLSPHEALYHNEISQIATNLITVSPEFINLAIAESDRSLALSPTNLNILRNRATLFLRLAQFEPKYLENAKETLITASLKAPTDAKIFYNLALVLVRTGETEQALTTFQKAIELKANYKEARFAHALILIGQNQTKQAEEELIYILKKIDPMDKQTLKELEMLQLEKR